MAGVEFKYILHWLLWLYILSFAFLPLVSLIPWSNKFSGYPVSRLLGLLLLSVVCWFAGHLKLWSLSSQTVFYTFLILALLSWLLLIIPKVRNKLRAELSSWKNLFEFEFVFILLFIVMIFIRILKPDIIGEEKMYEFAILKTLLRTTELPPHDPWLSGYNINYYYFGFHFFATLIRLINIPPEFGFNLSLALIFASIGAVSYVLIKQLSGNRLVGLLAIFFMLFGGNVDAVIQFVMKRSFEAFNMAQSSRIIPHTINEFPIFSFYFGYLHPHVIGLLFLVLVVYLFCDLWINTHPFPLGQFVFLGVVIGAGIPNSTWDVILFSILAIIISLRYMLRARSKERPSNNFSIKRFTTECLRLCFQKKVLLLCGSTFITAVAIALPFILHYKAPSLQKGFVPYSQHSELYPFLIIFAQFLAPLLLFLWLKWDASFKIPLLILVVGLLFSASVVIGILFVVIWILVMLVKDEESGSRSATNNPLIWVLLACGWVLPLIAELVYVEGPFGKELIRVNTVFKLYFESWGVLSLITPFIWFELIKQHKGFKWLLAVCVIVMAMYPLQLFVQQSRYMSKPPTINGFRFLIKEHTEDLDGIKWLDSLPGTPIVLEATGEAYRYLSRVSSYTGLPTVLGWLNHEMVHRQKSMYPMFEERWRDVPEMYNSLSWDRTRELLLKYKVNYVFVGQQEIESYSKEGLQKFAEHLPLKFISGNIRIYEVPR